MKTRISLIVTVLLFALAVCASATGPAAKSGPQGHNQHVAGVKQGPFAQLNLTDSQKAQIKTIKQASRKAIEAVEANSSLDQKAKKQQIKKLRQDSKTQIMALLTPEQKAKLQKLITQRKAKK